MAKNNDFGVDSLDNGSFGASSSETGVVKIGKREYAIALLWHKIEYQNNAANEAREMANSENFKSDFFCVRLNGDAQYGLGSRNLGHKAGMPSLAAQLADAKGGKWIGLFEVEGGYYLAGVNENAIMSECDRFFTDVNEAKDEFENYYNNSDWKEAIAPDNLEIIGTNEIQISKLLEEKGFTRLQPVSRRNALAKAVLGVVVVVGLVGGGYSYLEKLKDDEFAAKLAQDAIDAAKLPFTPQKEEIPIPEAPWISHPIASKLIESCVENVNKFPLDIPGWNVKELICDGQSGMVAAALDRAGELGRGGGSFNWIKQMVEKEGFSPTITPPPGGNGNRASVQWSLGDLPKIPVDLETIKVPQMSRGLVVVMDERFVPVTIGPGPRNDDFFKGIAFGFSTSEDPRNFTDIISALPGAFVTELRYDVDENTWRLEGQAYEQLPLPPKTNN